MKKIFTVSLILIAFMSTLFIHSCQKDDYSSKKQEFLDLDPANITKSQFDIYKKAQERINENVNFIDGKFSLNVKTGAEIDISERLFDYFHLLIEANNNQILEYTNNNLSLVEIERNSLVVMNPESSLSFVMTKSGNEIANGGYTGIVSGWGGTGIYLSNKALADITRYGYSFGAIVGACSAYFGSKEGGAVALALAAIGGVADIASGSYPNGLVIYHSPVAMPLYPFGGGFYYLSGQKTGSSTSWNPF